MINTTHTDLCATFMKPRKSLLSDKNKTMYPHTKLRKISIQSLIALSLSLAPVYVLAEADETEEDGTEIDTMIVEGRDVNLIGAAVSASEGVVGRQEIEQRPLLRSGEILELIPGVVVTQHSGTGKANQYFLRGFNLDHGTDFATFIDGMPINKRSHGHGQGYTDLNFIIPETISSLSYKKGAYYTEVGDFSGAGFAQMEIRSGGDPGMMELTLGEYDYRRFVALNSTLIDNSKWFYAIELNTDDGPWVDIEEDMRKANALLKYTNDFEQGHWSLTFMGYDNEWNSADQIPLRAVESGLISEFGSLDDTVGGESSRYSLSSHLHLGNLNLSAYVIDYKLNLWSNFTYFLDDPVNGDQFEQVDDRNIYGARGSYQYSHQLFNRTSINDIGLEIRHDDIDEVGLYNTLNRNRIGSVRSDRINQTSYGLYWQNEIQWNEKIRTVFGARYDYFDFDVATLLPMNSSGIDLSRNNGETDDDLFSLKGNLIYTLNDSWETYLSAGQGFHSNDARGTVIRVDPGSGEAIDPVDPLAASFGYELGIRGFYQERVNFSLALWSLELDSELIFVGDAGNTEPTRESERQGLEFTTYYHINEQWTADLEYSYTDAEFKTASEEGREIPGSIKHVLQSGLNYQNPNGWYGSVRLRYFGERPLIEDGSVESDPSTVVNVKTGVQKGNWVFEADILNLLDSNDHDIDYFYESRLFNEAAAVEDIHYHVLPPRMVRFSVAYKF